MTIQEIQFNISPSFLGVWFQSELMCLYGNILKMKPDTNVVQCYGKGGNIVHEAIEIFINEKDKGKAEKFFLESWDAKELDTDIGLNGRALSKQVYWDAMQYGIGLATNKYEIEKSEMEIILPLKGNKNKKGFIDLVGIENGVKKIVDWKTSNSMDGDTEQFRRQVLMYAHLYWCETGEIINHANIEYLKLKKTKPFEFTDKEVKEFGDYLLDVLAIIEAKGIAPSHYELGDWEGNPFNAHKKKCRSEKYRRDDRDVINVERRGNKLYFIKDIPEKLGKLINQYFSYKVPNYYWSDAYKKGVWDGSKRFLKRNSVPFPFVWKLIELIDAYNKKEKTSYRLNIEDYRDQNVSNAVYYTKFKENDVVLAKHQNESIDVALTKKVTLIYIGTSGGKTFLSAELIKKLNRRTIFVVNRVELVRQTKEAFEDYLGVEVGEMTEGNLDVSKQITVCGLQTLYAILKRDDEDSAALKKYLYNVTCAIFDEAQNVKDSGMYGKISENLPNYEYCISLSGSPFRSDGTTLEMNSLCGFIGYSKSTKELEKIGWITPTKSYFISLPKPEGVVAGQDFNENYDTFIIQHSKRNQIVADTIAKYRVKKKIMILVNRLDHGDKLSEMIPNSFFINGNTDKKLRKDKFAEFKNGKDMVLISMVKIASAGIDIPDLDMLFNCSTYKSGIDAVQSIGRVKRKKEGKKFGYFLDFYDEGQFSGFSKERKKILEEFGNPVEVVHYTELEKVVVE